MFRRRSFRTLAPAALALLVAACFIPQIAMSRRLSANTIDHDAYIISRGRHILVTGPLRCTQTETVNLRVTVTQRTTGAFAEGHLRFVGTTQEQHWQLIAQTQGEADFDDGPATATAVAISSLHGEATDAHQWLVSIDLHRGH